MRMPIALGSLIAVGGLLFLAVSNADDHGKSDRIDEDALPEVSVTLLESVRLVKRLPATKDLAEEPVASVNLMRPHKLTIQLPNGKRVSTIARSMFMISSDGIVIGVYLRRPLKPVRSGEAIADLRRTMKQMGIEPDELMRKQMATWPEDAAGFDEGVIPFTYGSWTPVCDEVDLGVELSPDPDGGWYYLMSFGASYEAFKAALAKAAEAEAKEAAGGQKDENRKPLDEK